MSQPLCYIRIIGFQNNELCGSSKTSESMLARDSFAFLLPLRSFLLFCHTFIFVYLIIESAGLQNWRHQLFS